MSTVRKLLHDKGETELVSVAATDTVFHALEIMSEKNTGAVLVTDGDQYVGILTERDYARKVVLKGHDSKHLPVRDIMTREMIMVKPETTVDQCVELMTKYHVRHLPVIENERVIGMVSLRRIALAMIERHKSTIVELENYIMGTGYGR
jgi:CBS domain-containing protein